MIERAVDEAHRHGHSYISTEHLLLGILRQGECTGARLLSERFTVSLKRARLATKRAFKAGRHPLPEDSRAAAERAVHEAFGVGTSAATSADQPTFDAAYKLTAYDGRGWRIKLSSGKETLPGRKQVFRRYDSDGLVYGDVIAKVGEATAANR